MSADPIRSEEHTSELQSRLHLVFRLLLEKKRHLIRCGHMRRIGHTPHSTTAGGQLSIRHAGPDARNHPALVRQQQPHHRSLILISYVGLIGVIPPITHKPAPKTGALLVNQQDRLWRGGLGSEAAP